MFVVIATSSATQHTDLVSQSQLTLDITTANNNINIRTSATN